MHLVIVIVMIRLATNTIMSNIASKARAYVFICAVNPNRLVQAQAMNGQRFTSTMPTALDTSIASAFLRLASVDALTLVIGNKLLGGMLVATLLV